MTISIFPPQSIINHTFLVPIIYLASNQAPNAMSNQILCISWIFRYPNYCIFGHFHQIGKYIQSYQKWSKMASDNPKLIQFGGNY